MFIKQWMYSECKITVIFFLLYNKKLSKLKMTFQHQPFSVLKVLDFADGNSSFVIKASSWMNSDAATDWSVWLQRILQEVVTRTCVHSGYFLGYIYLLITGPKCGKKITLWSTPPLPVWTMTWGMLDPSFSVFLHQILTLPSKWHCSNFYLSDQAGLFPYSVVWFWWVSVNCTFSFLLFMDRSSTRCSLLLL